MSDLKVCDCAPPSEYLRSDVDGWHCEHCGGLVKVIDL